MATFIIKTVGAIAAAASSRILADEFKAWRPWLTARVITLATRRLPADQRDRYEEEWWSYVEDTPGEVGRVLAALGLLWAAVQIGCASRLTIAHLLAKSREALIRFNVEIFTFALTIQLATVSQTLWIHHSSFLSLHFNGLAPREVAEIALLVINAISRVWLIRRQRRVRAAAHAVTLVSLSGAARSSVALNAELQELRPSREPPKASGRAGPRT
jgi:hypothetical protein